MLQSSVSMFSTSPHSNGLGMACTSAHGLGPSTFGGSRSSASTSSSTPGGRSSPLAGSPYPLHRVRSVSREDADDLTTPLSYTNIHNAPHGMDLVFLNEKNNKVSSFASTPNGLSESGKGGEAAGGGGRSFTVLADAEKSVMPSTPAAAAVTAATGTTTAATFGARATGGGGEGGQGDAGGRRRSSSQRSFKNGNNGKWGNGTHGHRPHPSFHPRHRYQDGHVLLGGGAGGSGGSGGGMRAFPLPPPVLSSNTTFYHNTTGNNSSQYLPPPPLPHSNSSSSNNNNNNSHTNMDMMDRRLTAVSAGPCGIVGVTTNSLTPTGPTNGGTTNNITTAPGGGGMEGGENALYSGMQHSTLHPIPYPVNHLLHHNPPSTSGNRSPPIGGGGSGGGGGATRDRRLHLDFKALTKIERQRVVQREAADSDLLERTVHLRFLPTSMKQGELAAMCRECGPYLRIRICGNSTDNQNWIYGFVEFETREGSMNLMRMNGREMPNGDGRPPLRLKCHTANQPIVDRVFHDADPASRSPCIFGQGSFEHRTLKDALDSYFNLKAKEQRGQPQCGSGLSQLPPTPPLLPQSQHPSQASPSAGGSGVGGVGGSHGSSWTSSSLAAAGMDTPSGTTTTTNSGTTTVNATPASTPSKPDVHVFSVVGGGIESFTEGGGGLGLDAGMMMSGGGSSSSGLLSAVSGGGRTTASTGASTPSPDVLFLPFFTGQSDGNYSSSLPSQGPGCLGGGGGLLEGSMSTNHPSTRGGSTGMMVRMGGGGEPGLFFGGTTTSLPSTPNPSGGLNRYSQLRATAQAFIPPFSLSSPSSGGGEHGDGALGRNGGGSFPAQPMGMEITGKEGSGAVGNGVFLGYSESSNKNYGSSTTTTVRTTSPGGEQPLSFSVSSTPTPYHAEMELDPQAVPLPGALPSGDGILSFSSLPPTTAAASAAAAQGGTTGSVGTPSSSSPPPVSPFDHAQGAAGVVGKSHGSEAFLNTANPVSAAAIGLQHFAPSYTSIPASSFLLEDTSSSPLMIGDESSCFTMNPFIGNISSEVPVMMEHEGRTGMTQFSSPGSPTSTTLTTTGTHITTGTTTTANTITSFSSASSSLRSGGSFRPACTTNNLTSSLFPFLCSAFSPLPSLLPDGSSTLLKNSSPFSVAESMPSPPPGLGVLEEDMQVASSSSIEEVMVAEMEKEKEGGHQMAGTADSAVQNCSTGEGGIETAEAGIMVVDDGRMRSSFPSSSPPSFVSSPNHPLTLGPHDAPFLSDPWRSTNFPSMYVSSLLFQPPPLPRPPVEEETETARTAEEPSDRVFESHSHPVYPPMEEVDARLSRTLESMISNNNLLLSLSGDEVIKLCATLLRHAFQQGHLYMSSNQHFVEAVETLQGLLEKLDIYEALTGSAADTTAGDLTSELPQKATQLRLLSNLMVSLLFLGKRSIRDAIPYTNALIRCVMDIPQEPLCPSGGMAGSIVVPVKTNSTLNTATSTVSTPSTSTASTRGGRGGPMVVVVGNVGTPHHGSSSSSSGDMGCRGSSASCAAPSGLSSCTPIPSVPLTSNTSIHSISILERSTYPNEGQKGGLVSDPRSSNTREKAARTARSSSSCLNSNELPRGASGTTTKTVSIRDYHPRCDEGRPNVEEEEERRQMEGAEETYSPYLPHPTGDHGEGSGYVWQLPGSLSAEETLVKKGCPEQGVGEEPSEGKQQGGGGVVLTMMGAAEMEEEKEGESKNTNIDKETDMVHQGTENRRMKEGEDENMSSLSVGLPESFSMLQVHENQGIRRSGEIPLMKEDPASKFYARDVQFHRYVLQVLLCAGIAVEEVMPELAAEIFQSALHRAEKVLGRTSEVVSRCATAMLECASAGVPVDTSGGGSSRPYDFSPANGSEGNVGGAGVGHVGTSLPSGGSASGVPSFSSRLRKPQQRRGYPRLGNEVMNTPTPSSSPPLSCYPPSLLHPMSTGAKQPSCVVPNGGGGGGMLRKEGADVPFGGVAVVGRTGGGGEVEDNGAGVMSLHCLSGKGSRVPYESFVGGGGGIPPIPTTSSTGNAKPPCSGGGSVALLLSPPSPPPPRDLTAFPRFFFQHSSTCQPFLTLPIESHEFWDSLPPMLLMNFF